MQAVAPPALSQAAAAGDGQAELRAAGAAFEALILQQMLQGVMPTGDAASSSALQGLATQLAKDSPFGIARLLERSAR